MVMTMMMMEFLSCIVHEILPRIYEHTLCRALLHCNRDRQVMLPSSVTALTMWPAFNDQPDDADVCYNNFYLLIYYANHTVGTTKQHKDRTKIN